MIKKIDLYIGDEDRVFVVGDIHGEITKLNNKLDEIGFDKEKDTLISVGDLIDRGEDSLACLSLIQEPWFKTVRGNHEDLMINSLLKEDENYIACWIQNGGGWYFNLNQEDQMYVKDLAEIAESEVPYLIELNYKGKKYVICHADYPENNYAGEVEDELLFDIIWSRRRIESFIKDQVIDRIDGADMFIFGHTPLRSVTHVSNCMYIDTGAVFNKDLTIVQL